MSFCNWVVHRLAILIAMLTCITAIAAPQQRPPNLLLILADDLGWGDVGFNGRKEWKTPNLNRLARQGTVFRRWYAGAVTCAPSRAVLMTGKYTIHNGVTANNDDLPADETTLPEALKPLGYSSALIGKWHHGRTRPGHTNYVHPFDHGFDEFFGFTAAIHAWQHFPTNLWHGRELKPVRGYTATLFAERSIDFIERHRHQPFFLYLALTESHFHIEAPAADVAKFAGRFPEKGITNVNATYAAMISRMDYEIGRVLKKLRDAGLEEDTLVVFSSDHGATFENGNRGASSFHDSNRPFRGQKRLLWEGGIRVPGVVRWPGKVPARKTTDSIVHMMDVFPTLLAAAGATPDPSWRLDGANLLPVWMGRSAALERTLFWEWRAENYNQVAAMRGDFKLVITGNTAPELYNLALDPAERRTIFQEFPQLGRDLRRQLADWLATESDAAKWGKTNRPALALSPQ